MVFNKILFLFFVCFGFFQMDPKPEANRVNQCNPNHTLTGPGHAAGFQGDRAKHAMDNKAVQGNPNNPKYHQGRK